jgi:acetylornithine deacetylase
MKKFVSEYVDAHSMQMAEFIASLIRTEPVNPMFVQDPGISEAAIQRLIKEKLEVLGLEVLELPVVLDTLKEYKGMPGYVPGVTDVVSFEGRPNILARLPGTDPDNARSVLLCGHCDVVGAEDAELWQHPPFEGKIKDGKIHGRGATDMLGGLGGMILAIETILKSGIKPRGDIWFASIICEEFGGTGTLALADWMKRSGIAPDIAIMGEPTGGNEISLLCRAIAFVDVVIKGRAGHLERTPEHFSDGGAVDAISKARYIMDAIDRLNADWRLRKDKDHPLINDPCQAKISMIRGGHHPSSYAENCTLSLDIQSLPHEQEDNLPLSVRREFEEFLMRACEADPWLRENPVEIQWKLDADCVEISQDHEFVQLLANIVKEINGGGRLYGKTGHYDGGWLTQLNGTEVVCFGAGDVAYAHARDEFCSIQRLVDQVKIVALVCLNWCK